MKKCIHTVMPSLSGRILAGLVIIIIAVGVSGSVYCENMSGDSGKFFILRKKMVEEQIVKRGIKDKRVIGAMLKVKRHLFVPEEEAYSAYDDRPLSIGYGQSISQPYIVALMTELLKLKKTDKVLEIGTGSGYQAAILAQICYNVYTVEIIKELGQRAGALLRDMGYKNVLVKIGNGYYGWKDKAPFDCIIVTAAPPRIPQPLVKQLREGGRMVIPVGKHYQMLKIISKKNGKIIKKDVIPVRFVPMTGKEAGINE